MSNDRHQAQISEYIRRLQLVDEAVTDICGLTGISREQLADYLWNSPYSLHQILDGARHGGAIYEDLRALARQEGR
jgi:predicted solute-binding protein